MTIDTRRRALLGGAGAAAAVLAAPAVAASLRSGTDRTAWQTALRDYQRADEEREKHWDEIEGPVWDRRLSLPPEQWDEILTTSDRLGDLKCRAEDRLFETPAPDLAALTTKLEMMFADQRDPIPAYQQLALADARRLAKEAGQ